MCWAERFNLPAEPAPRKQLPGRAVVALVADQHGVAVSEYRRDAHHQRDDAEEHQQGQLPARDGASVPLGERVDDPYHSALLTRPGAQTTGQPSGLADRAWARLRWHLPLLALCQLARHKVAQIAVALFRV